MRSRGPGCGCLGCGGSLLVLVLLGAAAWFWVLRPAQDFLNGFRAPSQTQSQTQGAPTPPAPTGNVNAALTRADVQKFVRVRRDVRQAMGESFTQVQQVWTDIQAGQTPNVLQVMGVLRSAGGSIQAARTAQLNALQREGLSSERYAVIRSGVNRALGLPNVDFARAAEALQRGQLPDLNGTVQTATPEEQALVKPFASELRVTAAAGLLGL